MPKRNNKPIKVVGVRRKSPDLEKLAKAIVALALEQLEREATGSPPPMENSALTEAGDAA
jgi:hypothetical protein